MVNTSSRINPVPSPRATRARKTGRLMANCIGFLAGFVVGAAIGTAFLVLALRLIGAGEDDPLIALTAIVVTALIAIGVGWATARTTARMILDSLSLE